MMGKVILRLLAVVSLICALSPDPAFTDVLTQDVAYFAGTVPGIPEGATGALDLNDSTNLRFKHQDKEFTLPYGQIASLEFGQTATARGRQSARGAALPAPPSKKGRHFLAIGFTEGDGRERLVIFELGKDVEPILATLAARAGKKVDLLRDFMGAMSARLAVLQVRDLEHPIPLSMLAKAPPTSVSLSVASTPPGATIYLDGARSGLTPATLSVRPGQHLIGLQKPGYRTWGNSLEVKDATDVLAELQQDQASPSIIKIAPGK